MLNDILKKLEKSSVVRGGIRFYTPEAAIELVSACKDKGVKILGIDAAFIRGHVTEPSLEHSIDLSDSRNSAEEALSFLNTRRFSNMYFDITI